LSHRLFGTNVYHLVVDEAEDRLEKRLNTSRRKAEALTLRGRDLLTKNSAHRPCLRTRFILWALWLLIDAKCGRILGGGGLR